MKKSNNKDLRNEDVEALKENINSKNTKPATISDVNAFLQYFEYKGQGTAFENIDAVDIDIYYIFLRGTAYNIR